MKNKAVLISFLKPKCTQIDVNLEHDRLLKSGKLMINKTIFFRIIRLISICASLLLLPFGTALAQDRIPAFEMNERLGRGVNMGNSFEAPSETAWGNPWKPEYFEIMAEMGFNHVRLPVRWEPADRSMATAPYTIEPAFLNRIKEVVDEALKNELHIIVNMHHHEALFDDPVGQKARFISQWEQIATFFKDYSDSLLFEVLNEPHGNLTPELWNEYFADALSEIRKTNPTRVVLMGVAEYGGLSAIAQLDLPADEYIIVSPHYYNPFQFTHQGAEWVDNSDPWLGTEWLDTEIDRETVENEFEYALQFSVDNKIPIHVGEFGAYGKADIESRERWTTFLARWFEEQNLSWAYWEFSAGFGVYDPVTKETIEPIFDALMVNPMPEPIPVYYTSIYKSNFTIGTDGWSFNTNGGAAGTIAANNGNLEVNITNGGTEGWHAQLTKGGFKIEEDSTYRVSFKASAPEIRSVSTYVGKSSDPWNAYSGYNGLTFTTVMSNYAYSFTMNDLTDTNARVVFDLGKNNTDIIVTDVNIERISIGDAPEPPITSIFDSFEDEISYYPNPVERELFIPSMDRFDRLMLMDIRGNRLVDTDIEMAQTSISMESYPAGMYFVILVSNSSDVQLKVLKN